MTWRDNDNLSDDDYQDLVGNAKRVGQKPGDGHYLKNSLKAFIIRLKEVR